MKKLLIGLLIALLIIIAAAYIFIPSTITSNNFKTVPANHQSVTRTVMNNDNWKNWWPGKVVKQEKLTTLLSYEGYDFKLENIQYNTLTFSSAFGKDSALCFLYVFPAAKDSVRLQWSTSIISGNNPFTKISRYFALQKMNKVNTKIINALVAHFSETKNIYGIDIKKEKVAFQNFVSTKKSFDHYPDNVEIYKLIAEVRQYVESNNGKEIFYPILNITTKDSSSFETQVAIAVENEMPGTEAMQKKWMMKGGNILSSELQGGTLIINSGFEKMKTYISDHNLVIIAIPFQMLITDRMKEPDSTKWVTKLYYPFM